MSHLGNIVVPKFSLNSPVTHSIEANEDATDLLEWLGLLSLNSPRVTFADRIDPYLSRYAVPYRDRATQQDLVSLKWKGFIPASWMEQLFLFTV